ncbi:histidine kinase [Nostoc calcicola FACHB-389]|nr:AAA family ATPase [Nostoc calcicola FACHB-3891]OKH17238.1 histidine kinase [Nostoc calcicola FACHB-389]
MNIAIEPIAKLLNYQITEQLYTSFRTLVYRAIREDDRLPVIIKLLHQEYPTFSELLQFRNQYTIAKNLDLQSIVRPYSLEPYRNSYALVMEDFGGISLREWMKIAMESNPNFLEEFLDIAIALSEILDGLYRHRVIHKDIKPANILINPETKQVKLIDFSIASLLPRETQEIQNPNVLEGTLVYLSPEQTGRMNRGIDYRSDYYSLGITFYELLTGQLPFESNDPMELIHCHIAKQPPRLGRGTGEREQGGEIPQVLCDIVMKLMAKNAENRYQSALGLKHDLEVCRRQLQETGEIKAFELGKRDICDRFIIPEKLYGRQAEVEILLDAFDRVANPPESGLRGVEIMLVAGFSGIGKTAVVNEVHKPIVRQRGYFIKGKFDQFQRNIPFSAFVQAFRDLMTQLLSESDTRLEQWKSKLLQALGENGQVMIEVIPELESLIGKQPPATELSPSAAQNRFNLLFLKFAQVFAAPEHPLVIFIDDLQWADSASLKLMHLLMSEADIGYLLLIGAYRDNEVNQVHPLLLTLDEIQKLGATVNTITLAPLDRVSVNHLVADTLSCSMELAAPLTDLVLSKTKGNPFFCNQFLKALHQDRLITFNFEGGYWECDLAQVRSLSLTDDVVEFMAIQLQKLPTQTQEVLKLAACVGNQFDLATLAIIHEKSQIETAADFWKAVQDGLIIPINEVYKFYQDSSLVISHLQRTNDSGQITGYKFLHDRVQQAAYSLIPESQKQATHLKIGQLLLKSTSPEAIEVNIFDIVNQFNEGIDIIYEEFQRYELAQLNLMAGKKAKASTAYKASVKYFILGRKLLQKNSWQTHQTLTFELYRQCGECEYLIGNFTEAEKLFNIALSHSEDKFDRAEIYGIQMYLKMTQGENIEAGFSCGLKGLSIMGMNLPVSFEEQQAAIDTEVTELKARLIAIRPADLFDLPEMTDPVKKVCMSLLADLWAAAYMGGHQNLSCLIPILMISLSLSYGNAESSGFAYCLYGMSLANQGNYQTAYEFGKLALKLDRHFNNSQFIPKTNNIFAHTINPYHQHLKTNLPISGQSFQVSQETGNLVFGVWAVSFYIWAMLIKGDRLSDIYVETDKYLSYVQQVNDANMLYAFNLQRQFILNLQGISKNTDFWDNDNDQDIPYIEVWRQKHNFEHGINWYCFLKIQLSYIYGRYADAIQAAEEAKNTLPSNSGFFPIIQYHFYYPLTLAAVYPNATSDEKKQYWEIMQEHQQIQKNWANNCPKNFLHRYLLLSAEMARISGKYMNAIELYDRAIAKAKKNEYLNEEALANELAAKFYLEWGKERIAQEYLINAYYCFARWDAKAKIDDLEQRYPRLLAPILQQTRSRSDSERVSPLTPNDTIGTLDSFATLHPSMTKSVTSSSNVSFMLDMTTVLKASQTLSSEIELEKLLAKLLSVAIENAGADKCVLLLLKEDVLVVEATAEVGRQSAVLQSIPVDDSTDVPRSLIYAVKRNLQPSVIIDTAMYSTLIADPYIIRHQPKSLLCVPILHQGKLLGILYLENTLTTGAFTSERVEILNLLCTQVAISLENARLYQQAQDTLKTLGQTEQFLRLIIDNIPQSVFWKDRNSVYLGCNRKFADDSGVKSPENVVGKTDYDLSSTRDESDWYVECDRRVMESGQAELNIIETWQQADGKQIWSNTNKIPLRDKEGNVFGILGTCEDITEREEAEQSLQHQKQELEQALQELQTMQLQLVQNEKMSALGNLVAGVAHEINNPIGFIAGNIEPAKDYIKDLFGLINLYQEKFPRPGSEIEDEIDAMDLNYLREDLPKLLDSMKLGVSRIRSISNSLRTFSRADRDYKVPFDIHEGIDSTILILRHRLKANENRPGIEIVKDYGQLPPVECFAGQLNQVFMNLLANAVDALEEYNAGRSLEEILSNPNCITIQTRLANSGNDVLIKIADNGVGMSPEVKQKVFDHLFTTKPVGKGTGLGLAIARQIIVEGHGGSINCTSELGRGTEFVIKISTQQN